VEIGGVHSPYKRDPRTAANVKGGDEILYKVEIYKASSKFIGFPWILVIRLSEQDL
jgi:hypothetical protein